MLDVQQVVERRGQKLIDANGDKIGKIEEIYLDEETGQPEWVLVNMGLFGSKSSFVPLEQASIEGDSLRVPYDKEAVKDAPKIEPGYDLSQPEEAELYSYYGMTYSERPSSTGLPEGRSGGQTTDDAMTRSEEEVHVGTAHREAGRVRLRKYVVTENVQQTVPVSHEEVRVEREPITDANVDEAMAGPELSEEEHEVVLQAEEPVIEKETVPRERVRLDKEAVTDEEQVSAEVRKEQIDLEDEGRQRR
ncbi:MAG: PRC and DUF2382 domain-containing protein [Actinomycetota bacterium]|nr:PRC and DUF2382 domain-containing protein [Actinomycetota bacterium]